MRTFQIRFVVLHVSIGFLFHILVGFFFQGHFNLFTKRKFLMRCLKFHLHKYSESHRKITLQCQKLFPFKQLQTLYKVQMRAIKELYHHILDAFRAFLKEKLVLSHLRVLFRIWYTRMLSIPFVFFINITITFATWGSISRKVMSSESPTNFYFPSSFSFSWIQLPPFCGNYNSKTFCPRHNNNATNILLNAI